MDKLTAEILKLFGTRGDGTIHEHHLFRISTQPVTLRFFYLATIKLSARLFSTLLLCSYSLANAAAV
ncbi:MAG TPA: hypothetical protein VL356_04790 [Acidocella sp.]|jgi:hypothetical protein|nr:hypothetical protein [Acidocella sp.]